MKLIKSIAALSIVLFIMVQANTSASSQGPKDLVAYVGYLPYLVETESKGPFIELVKAIDEVYLDGEIKIRVFPIRRAMRGIETGEADMFLPAFRHPRFVDNDLPLRFSTTAFGKVTHVLYMNKNKTIDVKQLHKLKNLKLQSTPDYWPFHVEKARSLESALQMVNAGRIDGVLWAQEEADVVLRRLNLRNVRRVFVDNFDDVFLIQKGPRGDYVDKILTEAINQLKVSGRLKSIYENIHRPYVDWQPK